MIPLVLITFFKPNGIYMTRRTFACGLAVVGEIRKFLVEVCIRRLRDHCLRKPIRVYLPRS